MCGDGATRQGWRAARARVGDDRRRFFDDGPAKDAAGEVRGNGVPVPVTAAVARVVAAQALDRGATTCVLLTDPDGHLTRLLRVGRAPETGWTREALVAATRRAIGKQPEPRHDTSTTYRRVEIADFVAARDPVCTFPGCAVPTTAATSTTPSPTPAGRPRPEPVAQIAPVPPLQDRRPLALPHAHQRIAARSSPTSGLSPLGTRQVVEVEPLPC